MWDTVQTNQQHLSHDLPCPRCGHAVHTFLACGDSCACEPVVMPGSLGLAPPEAAARRRAAQPSWAPTDRQ